MASFIRGKVSKKKKRFKEDGFDLDLTYITPRIIAMGFPADNVEGFYRNPIGEVQRFYEKRHKDAYKLYNLCAERDYDHSKFHNRVSHYPFEDHNAPPIQLIVDCCKDVDDWLKKDEKNVVGINCKAGKGRTGLIICCYLMHSEVVKTSEDAMLYYGTRRTKDGKGVTIASQQRYVRYYEHVLKLGKVPEPRLLKIRKLKVHTVPNFAGDPFIVVIIKGKEVYTSKPITVPKKAKGYEIECDAPIYADVKLQICIKKGGGSQKVCHFWFNTAFISESNTIELVKSEIDVANKDKRNAHFSPDFKLEMEFENIDHDDPKLTKKDKKKKNKPSKENSKVSIEKVKSTEKKANKNSKKDDDDEDDDETFEKKRKRAQSFYDIAEEDEYLSDSEIDEKEMEKYFQVEEEEGDNDVDSTANGATSDSESSIVSSSHSASSVEEKLEKEKSKKSSNKKSRNSDEAKVSSKEVPATKDAKVAGVKAKNSPKSERKNDDSDLSSSKGDEETSPSIKSKNSKRELAPLRVSTPSSRSDSPAKKKK